MKDNAIGYLYEIPDQIQDLASRQENRSTSMSHRVGLNQMTNLKPVRQKPMTRLETCGLDSRAGVLPSDADSNRGVVAECGAPPSGLDRL